MMGEVTSEMLIDDCKFGSMEGEIRGGAVKGSQV